MDYGIITTEYLCYLMNRIGLEAEGDDGYLLLCRLLQETVFDPQTYMDENRCYECRNLRMDFQENDYGANDIEGNYVADILDAILPESGTMMELLTVLAEKLAFELSDSEYEAAPRKWFTEMLCNCGISDYAENKKFEEEGNEETIKNLLHTVIYRKIGWDGEGGLFPLMYAQTDQRREELITQMNYYIEENYDIC